MSTCLEFDPEVFSQVLQQVKDSVGIDLTVCDTSGGKKMRGGMFNKGHVRKTIWTLTSILIAYVGWNFNKETLKVGINMLMSGECSSLSENFISRLFFVGNPVCSMYTSSLNTIIGALRLDPTSLAMLTGVLGLSGIGSFAYWKTVNEVINQIADRLGLEEAPDVQPAYQSAAQPSANSLTRQRTPAPYRWTGNNQSFSTTGGKKTKKQKNKKRKTKRHIKNKKNRRRTKKY
jgi:hypothetical protein